MNFVDLRCIMKKLSIIHKDMIEMFPQHTEYKIRDICVYDWGYQISIWSYYNNTGYDSYYKLQTIKKDERISIEELELYFNINDDDRPQRVCKITLGKPL